MPPKARVTIRNAPTTPQPLKEYQRILNTLRSQPKYRNTPYRELQQIAKKIYQKL